MNQLKCSKCYNPIESSDKFCPHCGAPVNESNGQVLQCPKCNHENPTGSVFCESCGTSLKGNDKAPISPPEPKKDEPKTFTSAGNYSGTMVKGKTSKAWKRFKIILLIVLIIALIAFVIWYKTDPNAKEIMGNVLFGGAIMLIFGFFIWRKNRNVSKAERIRRKREANLDDLYDQDNDDDNDFDDDDNDDFDDD